MKPFEIQYGEQWAEMARKARYQSGLLSTALGISQRQLQRETKACFGCSPYVWLNAQRLKRASDLLQKCRSVKAVCFDLDFKQPSHFSRQFKDYYGQSPSAFLAEQDNRKEQRNGTNSGGQQLNFEFMSRLDTRCPT